MSDDRASGCCPIATLMSQRRRPQPPLTTTARLVLPRLMTNHCLFVFKSFFCYCFHVDVLFNISDFFFISFLPFLLFLKIILPFLVSTSLLVYNLHQNKVYMLFIKLFFLNNNIRLISRVINCFTTPNTKNLKINIKKKKQKKKTRGRASLVMVSRACIILI